MSAIIKHTGAAAEVFAPTLEVLAQATCDKAQALVKAADALIITDPASFAKANDLATVMYAEEKAITARKEYLKRPIIDVGKAIDVIIDASFSPLTERRKAMAGKISAWDKKLKDEAAAIQRKKEQEAEAERQRLQKIADDKHAEEVRVAQEKAAQEAKELAELLGAPVEVAPVAVAPAPKVEAPRVEQAAAPLPAAAVTTRMVPELVVDEHHPLLAAFDVGGERLININRAGVKRVLEAGAVLPWARMVLREQTAMKAVRS